MSQIRKQHAVTVDILEKSGLQNVRLERKPDGTYRYYAWSVPLVDGNGSPRITRQGKIPQRQLR